MHEAQVKLIQQQSSLLLQKRTHGFSGELKSSGVIVENYIKSLLMQHLPAGYRLSSGYIATTETIAGPENLAQHDIIITDGRIPPIYQFGFGDIEVVPAEAVCGIVEIKRTLTKASLNDAIEHLQSTRSILEQYDNGAKSKVRAANNAAGPSLSVATRAPLYAIVSLDALKDELTLDYLNQCILTPVQEFIDFIWAIAASWLVRFVVAADDGQAYFPLNVSRNLPSGTAHCMVDLFKEAESGRVHGMALTCFRTWINSTSGISLDIGKHTRYFGA